MTSFHLRTAHEWVAFTPDATCPDVLPVIDESQVIVPEGISCATAVQLLIGRHGRVTRPESCGYCGRSDAADGQGQCHGCGAPR